MKHPKTAFTTPALQNHAAARWLAALTVLAAALVGACESSGHGHGAPGATKPPEGLNPVQHEMRLLHEALRDTVSAVANGNVSTVPDSIHRVHGAKEATSRALKEGAYAPPKNPKEVQRFSEMDEAFHGDLVKLVVAAESGDVPATGRALGQVMSGCHGCHEHFRFGADR